MIRYRPSTGYQLKSNFDQSINFFWSATLPQIYRTLNQMESDGGLRAAMETQVGKPNRKIYYLTEKRNTEFVDWLNSPFELMELKHSALIKIFFTNMADPQQIAENLQELRNYCESFYP